MASRNVLTLLVSKRTLLILITFFALLARFWKIEFMPFQNDADELAFVFAGQSLIEKGVPISWSSFEYDQKYVYTEAHIGDPAYNTEGTVTLISPWFDHPYLVSILQGVWTEAFGYRFPSAPPSLLMRIPMLGIALVTLLLFWKLVSVVFSEKTALITYIAFAFSPSFVLGQRMVIGENFIVPLLLATVLIIVKKSEKWYFLLPVLATLALLSKMTGILVLLTIGLAFLLRKDWKRLGVYVGASIGLFLVFYFPFAYALGWNEFVDITSKQSFRLLGWVNPAFIMANPGFHHYTFYDLSYYLFLVFGIVGVVIAPKKQSHELLQFLTLGALILLWSTSAEQDALGWYKLPLFTLLAINVGFVIEKMSLAAVAIIGSVVVTNNFGLVKFVENPYPTTEKLRAIVSALVIFPVLGAIFLNKALQKKLATFGLIIICLVYIGQSLYIADSLYDARCQHIKCPIPTLTTTALLKGLIK